VLYIHYQKIVEAFDSQGIDIHFDESTPDKEFQRCVRMLEKCTVGTLLKIKNHLLKATATEIDLFLKALENHTKRLIKKIIITPIFGDANEFSKVEQAIEFLDTYPTNFGSQTFKRLEIQATFSNGDRIEGSFNSTEEAKRFLSFISDT
jgi:hypothetical protein